MTELQKLKKKKKDGKATPGDLTRLKLLQEGEPLSKADLENAKKREADREAKDKADYDARKKDKEDVIEVNEALLADTTLDIPAEHPRIAKIKQALMPFTQIEAHDSRPDEFVLLTRGISITAGDVRQARKAMTL